MPVSLPTIYGKADWTDYVDNWRESDAEYLQARGILRFDTNANRDAALPSPTQGQFIYNASLDGGAGGLEMRTASAWVPYKSGPAFLKKTADDANSVAISHDTAGGKGIIFRPVSGPNPLAKVEFSAPIDAMGVLTAESGANIGVRIKTGAKTVKLTTDATNLVLDSPLTVPGLTNTGAFATASSTVSGTLTANTGTFTTINLSGTMSGGSITSNINSSVVNGTSGTIGGVAHAGNQATAPGGFISNIAFVGPGGIFAHRNTSSGVTSAGITVDTTYLRMRAANGIPVDNFAGGWLSAWVGIVYTSDPGAANAPPGSILFL